MAQEQESPALSNSFQKGLNKDLYSGFVPEGVWTHARNAVNRTRNGQMGVLAREASTETVLGVQFTVIGLIHKSQTEWVVFSTDDEESEIGVIDELTETYKRIVVSKDLRFKKTHLITGVCRKQHDDTFLVYWQDGLNPDRCLNLDRVPYREIPGTSVGDCYVPSFTDQLDTDAILLQPKMITPLFSLNKSLSAGSHLNGAYQVCAAYSIDGIRVTDYFTPSNIQTLFEESGVGGSLDVTITQMDQDFDEFELVLIAFTNQQAQARRVGFYSTRSKTITIDSISGESAQIPLEQIPLQTPVYDKSDLISQVGNHLLRSGVSSQPEFNYQKLANQITMNWVSVAYPAEYYYRGGNKTSYMRDEVYPHFIRWVYNTGLRTASWPLIGREATEKDRMLVKNSDALTGESERWQIYNTAEVSNRKVSYLPDGGRVIARGRMGYWESTIRYPDNKPEIWGDLCGKPIRHPKMPDHTTAPETNHFVSGGDEIILLGVEFENIPVPLGEDEMPIEGIIGYEILRGNRDGHKSVVAKGMFNNMRQYDVKNSRAKGLFQNFPYNSRQADKYHIRNDNLFSGNVNDVKSDPLTAYRKDIFSFHSPDTTFRHPYLSSGLEVKIDRELKGTVTGFFEHPYKHPRQKLLTEGTDKLIKLASVLSVLSGVFGSKTIRMTGTSDIPLDTEVTSMPAAYPGSGNFGNVINAVYFIGAKVANVAAIAALSIATNEQLSMLVYSLLPWQKYALQYQSHGFYNEIHTALPMEGQRRRLATMAKYIKSNVQSFDKDLQVNNLHRNEYVAVRLSSEINDPKTVDDSRFLFDEGRSIEKVGQQIFSTTSAYYGAIKIRQPSQYGSIDSVNQLLVRDSYHAVDNNADARYKSGVLFGGEIYINRYTEKSTMFFFNTWMYDMPDGTDFDYRDYVNIPYPRYWVNAVRPDRDNFKRPAQFRHLNRKNNVGGGLFYVKNAYYYLFNSGVRDFFVESEINLAHRSQGNQPSEEFYDPQGAADLSRMFRTDQITAANFYKYDSSLSVANNWVNKISWGSVVPRSFNPAVETKRKGYNPFRTIYSLPQQVGLKKDNWRVYLANNYKDFGDRVTAFKSVNSSGALVLFQNDEPVQMVGADQLQTEGGVKLTIGDGGLFQQPLQQVTNADDTLGYASCQHHRSVVNTPHGLFFMSQQAGKIFSYTGQVEDIGQHGLKHWLNEYLPCQLLKEFPDYKHKDNTVMGVGCQAVYDPKTELLYFSKRDFKAKSKDVRFDGSRFFINLLGRFHFIELGDPLYFTDCSWTISFDPMQKVFVSYHDWNPGLFLPSFDHFISVKNQTFYRHNKAWNSFGNYYGKDFPFEVEFPVNSGKQITTLRSIEYQAEALRYFNEGRDVFHVLDSGFDKALIHNTEQTSGWLRLETKAKNDPLSSLKYPILTATGIRIQQDKEEHRFRFNQFYDITRDRGEFTKATLPLFNHHPNGFTRQVNFAAVDYAKPSLQHKKFRHYLNKVMLRKTRATQEQLLVRLVDSKIQLSPR